MNSRSICTFTLAVAGSLSTGIAAQNAGDDLADRLAANAALVERVQPLLPPGASLQAAASGFRDEGDFLAALHLSRDLNIPFNELKADLTGAKRHNLTAALRDLRPELRAGGIARQVKKAQRQAQADLQVAGELAENSGK